MSNLEHNQHYAIVTIKMAIKADKQCNSAELINITESLSNELYDLREEGLITDYAFAGIDTPDMIRTSKNPQEGELFDLCNNIRDNNSNGRDCSENSDAAEISKYHFYLAKEVIDATKGQSGCFLHMSNDDLISQIFPYGIDYFQVIDDLYNEHDEADFPGVAVYELSEFMAKLFISECDPKRGRLPDREQLKESMKKVAEAWFNDIDLTSEDEFDYVISH